MYYISEDFEQIFFWGKSSLFMNSTMFWDDFQTSVEGRIYMNNIFKYIQEGIRLHNILLRETHLENWKNFEIMNTHGWGNIVVTKKLTKRKNKIMLQWNHKLLWLCLKLLFILELHVTSFDVTKWKLWAETA